MRLESDPGVELSISDALHAAADAMDRMAERGLLRTQQPVVVDVQVKKVRRGFLLSVKYRGGSSHEVRLSRAWATVLAQRLARFL